LPPSKVLNFGAVAASLIYARMNRGIKPRIARRGVETIQKLGRLSFCILYDTSLREKDRDDA
jgi:hypothetical protein